MSPDGRLSWILSLHNPYDCGLYVEEVSASVSVFFESLVPWDGRTMACSLSLWNSASDLLSLVNIQGF